MDTKLWRYKALSTQLLAVFYVTALFLFSQPQGTHASRSISKNHRDLIEVPSTQDEVEADFLSWVASVGAAYKNVNVATSSSPRLINSGTKVVTPLVYYVDIAGFGNFKTVQEAVNAVPDDNSVAVLIVVKAGTYRYVAINYLVFKAFKNIYFIFNILCSEDWCMNVFVSFMSCREKVTIPKSKARITMQGAGRNVTCIEYDMNAATAGSTYDSATVAVFSDYFVARDISFKVKFNVSHLGQACRSFS